MPPRQQQEDEEAPDGSFEVSPGGFRAQSLRWVLIDWQNNAI
jgi:hypothetical protein